MQFHTIKQLFYPHAVPWVGARPDRPMQAPRLAMMAHSQPIHSRPADEDEPTGPSGFDCYDDARSESSFSCLSDAESSFSIISWDAQSVQSTSGQSVGAHSLGACSIGTRSVGERSAGARSIGASSVLSTAAADHVLDNGGATAFTVGLPVPLSSIPAAFLQRPGVAESDEDGHSLASVNTRRGWPRISPAITTPAEPTLPASYRDMLLTSSASVTQSAAAQPARQHKPSGKYGAAPPRPRLAVSHPPAGTQAVLVGGRVTLADRRMARGAGRLTRCGRRCQMLSTLPEYRETSDDEGESGISGQPDAHRTV